MILVLGASFGIAWGLLALELLISSANVPAILFAPVWLTTVIASAGVAIEPLALGVLVSIALGLVPAALIVGYLRWRER